MKVLVFIPAYNEEKTVAGVVRQVPRQIGGVSQIDVLVLDDGSSDNTVNQAEQAGARVINNLKNCGLSFSFQRGAHEALSGRYDFMVSIDADGQFNPGDIAKLIQPIVSGQADFATASRFKDSKLTPAMPMMKVFGNRMVARLISFISHQKFYDVSCGFRAYSREALLNLNLFSKFTYTHETFLNLIFKDLKIAEIPLAVRGEREYGESKIARSLWRYGYNIANTIFRTMLDYKPLKFFGWGGAILFVIGLALDIFVGVHWLVTGMVSPFKTFGFVGLFFNLFGLLLVIVGLLADMINRVRLTQERILYYEKKRRFDG